MGSRRRMQQWKGSMIKLLSPFGSYALLYKVTPPPHHKCMLTPPLPIRTALAAKSTLGKVAKQSAEAAAPSSPSSSSPPAPRGAEQRQQQDAPLSLEARYSRSLATSADPAHQRARPSLTGKSIGRAPPGKARPSGQPSPLIAARRGNDIIQENGDFFATMAAGLSCSPLLLGYASCAPLVTSPHPPVLPRSPPTLELLCSPASAHPPPHMLP